MEFKGPMLLVKDMERSKKFYTEVLSLEIVMDLGANVSFSGGPSLQTQDSWTEFTGANTFQYGGNDAELYFEEPDFDGFMKYTQGMNLELLGGVIEMPWGQRVLRFYDPDKHIVQVGEELTALVKRLHREGLNMVELTAKTYIPKEALEFMLNS